VYTVETKPIPLAKDVTKRLIGGGVPTGYQLHPLLNVTVEVAGLLTYEKVTPIEKYTF